MSTQDLGLPDIRIDQDSLYREETFTDRRAGTLRRLVPVLADGSPDAARPVLWLGQTQLMTPGGVLPLGFEIDAPDLASAIPRPSSRRSRTPSKRRNRCAAKPPRASSCRTLVACPPRERSSSPDG